MLLPLYGQIKIVKDR